MSLIRFITFPLILQVVVLHAKYAFACEDVASKFDVTLEDGTIIQKNCKQVTKNRWGQCAKLDVQRNCPVTCSLCPDDLRCRIKADLQFPEGPEDFRGDQEATVQIEKIGEKEACFSGSPKQRWGCTQVIFNYTKPRPIDFGGNAKIESENGFYNKKHASARVYDGRDSTFRVGVSHIFTEAEVASNTTARSKLIVRVNGDTVNTFRAANNQNQPTHIDYNLLTKNSELGFINPRYDGDYFVRIKCDDKCNCEAEKETDKCVLKAQLKFPELSDINGFGKRTETVAITNKNKDDEICSEATHTTSWCRSYSKAVIANIEDPFYYDQNSAQFVIIPDSSNGHFLVQKYQTIEDGEQLLTGNKPQFDVYINGEKFEYDEERFNSILEIKCDASCNCNQGIVI